jgi:hypothetical protein
MKRRTALGASTLGSIVVFAVAAAPAPAPADAPQCPPGFNGGAQTFEQRLNDPGIQAALAAGLITLEQAEAIFAANDENGNGFLCVQDNTHRAENANPITGWLYADIVRDDLG